MEPEELKKLIACMKRAKNGEEMVIGFLGGSITQGSLASSDTLTYAYRVYQWWCGSFPQSICHYVNGGIGGTTSCFGVARADEDVLMYQPDVVFVDFSVNDEPTPFFQETYEGVIRKLLGWRTQPAVVVLNNVYYDTGVNAQEYHNAVAKHYQVPYVSIKDTVYQKMIKGVYSREELTPDGLHPNDKGHGLLAEEIIRLLEKARTMMEGQEPDGTAKEKCEDFGEIVTLPKALTENAYQDAKRLTIRNSGPMLQGFHADTEEKKGHLDFFKNGWTARKKGDRIVFREKCSCIAVQYRKTIHKPTPVARLILDGDTEHAVILDGNFEEDWGDCLYLEPVLHHGTYGEHMVEIEIIKAGEDDQSPFYLLSLIVA